MKVPIGALNDIDTAASCLRGAAQGIRDTARPNNTVEWDTAIYYDAVADRLKELRDALVRM